MSMPAARNSADEVWIDEVSLNSDCKRRLRRFIFSSYATLQVYDRL